MEAPSQLRKLSVHVNGKYYSSQIESRMTLAEFLREELDLTGTKVGCNRAECGTCTVLLNGRPVYSCTTLAVTANGKDVETIEGVAKDGILHPLQQAMIDHDGLQCGFCTPGMVMSLKALIDRNSGSIRELTRGDIRDAISGNYCRCGAYPNIVEAVVELQRGRK